MKKTLILTVLLICLTLPAVRAQLINKITTASKNWAVGIEGSFGPSVVENKILSSMDLETNLHEWVLTTGFGYKAEVVGKYFLNNHLSLKTGLGYHSYESNFTLSGTFTDNKLSRDINEDVYQKVIGADYDSAISLSYISLPIAISYDSNRPGKNGFFAEVGLNFSISSSAKYHSTGTYDYYGYYSQHPEPIQYLHIEELGYFSREGIDEKGKIGSSAINVSVYASFGLNVAFGDVLTMKLGPEIYYGLTDAVREETFFDVFGRTKMYKPTVIWKYGGKVSFIFRL